MTLKVTHDGSVFVDFAYSNFRRCILGHLSLSAALLCCGCVLSGVRRQSEGGHQETLYT